MRPLTLSQIAAMTAGRVVGEDITVERLLTDTRGLASVEPAVRASSLFVALKGERFDGHDHLGAAADAGIGAALVSRVEGELPQVLVGDTQLALADLARGLQASRAAKVVAITGSNGKTSVKTLTLAILELAGRTYGNPGNRNNEIGLPLAVIDAPEDAEFAVYEMGAGQPGDIAYLTAIARPDVSIVNNIAPAHLERMGSLLGVADTKAAIYDALPEHGVAVINADDAFAPYFAERAKGRRHIRFGLEASADVTARDIALSEDGSTFTMVTPQGEAAVEIAMPGRHNVRNALAAASLALGAGVPLATIVRGLAAARPVAGRLVTHRLPNGATLIDDSYNANPGSVGAAIDALAAMPGASWLVLGDMRELGDDAEALHAQVGTRAREAGLARLYTLGPLSAAAARAFGADARHFETHDALADALRADLPSDARVLVKGSRGSAMDRIVAALLSGTPHAA
ncbi:UDP-N-acetylmuramoyl-tripeptide--D-alanyl-D-alanine ligase [Cognatilysobacter segetis]|uniref:UDP-N-acetylmuramoyl-tripeptide--D-alanyl-D- alanine ligase n=1 Tax=Cognatilysobacter segetis TaxID=2492394 RepID=UPI00105ECD3B|nr:UDP-N-acetylmuramoyl-tripeptide--D-alanyl-D-alanine ligase [Lysobacter segetis]